MARTNTYTCATCGEKYEFCIKCQVTLPNYDAGKFCSKKHAEIYAILSKHGCNLITADEALKELAAYNLDEITLTENILAHVERIKSEATSKVEKVATVKETATVEPEATPVVKEETVAKNNINKNKKKKW